MISVNTEGILERSFTLKLELLLEQFIQICETNSNSKRLKVLKENNSVEYERALELSFD